MTVRYKGLKHPQISASAIIGGSSEAAEVIARIAVNNILENKITAVLLNKDVLTKDQIESMIREGLETQTQQYLAQIMETFKHNTLFSLSEINVALRVSNMVFDESGGLRDIIIEVHETKKEAA